VIRPVTMFWIALAGCVGFGLYHLKNEVQAQEDQLFRVNRTILAEQETIHVLRAEWSYLNQPARLQALASRHLELQPTKPAQLGTIATLPPLQPESGSPALAAVPPLPAAAAPTRAPAAPRIAAATQSGHSTAGLN
jgi:hypothetical protein